MKVSILVSFSDDVKISAWEYSGYMLSDGFWEYVALGIRKEDISTVKSEGHVWELAGAGVNITPALGPGVLAPVFIPVDTSNW